MKGLIIFITTIFLCNTVCLAQKSLNREKDFLPYLNEIVDNYYFYHYEYPTDIKRLIKFTEYSLEARPDNFSWKENITLEVLPYLKNNSREINLKEKGGYTIQIKSDTLLYIPPSSLLFSPCEDSLFIGKEPREYYHFHKYFKAPRFFSLSHKALLYPERVYKDFSKAVEDIQRKEIKPDSALSYRYYIYEKDTVPIFSTLEYKLNEPLRYYCNGQQVKRKLPLYDELESFLSCFCELHKCSRIIFSFLDYD